MSDADERLIVMLEARISEFEKRMAKAEGTATRSYKGMRRGSQSATRAMERDMALASVRINQSLASISGQIGKFGAAFGIGLGVGALSSFASAARGAVRNMADLADQADRIGMDVETFQGLKAGLQLSGVAANEAAGGLENFAQRLGDAASGQGELYKTLSRSGVAIRDQSGELRSTVDVMRDFADAVQGVQSPAERMAMVTDAFGKGGKAMVLAMAEGSAGIDEMIRLARESGVVIDEEMIRKAAKLDDQFDLVAQRMKTIWQTGVIGAAEFFGLVDSLSGTFFQNSANYEAILEKFGSADAAAAMAGGWLALEEILKQSNAVEILGDMAYSYDVLQNTANRATSAMAGDIAALSEEYPILGQALGNMAGEVDRLSAALQAALDAGDVEAAKQYQAELGVAVDNLSEVIAKVDEISGLDLSGAVSWADTLAVAWEGVAVAASRAASASLGVDTGTPLSGDQWLLPPGEGSVETSPRPREAPPMLGEPDLPATGGGGGGSRRIEALLAELQTEREVLDAWYEESLQLLNEATDAQLEALGGRHEAEERLEAEHLERLRAIRDEGQGSILANAETFFGEMAAAAAMGGEKLVRVQRVFAAAEALINTYRAASQVLGDPTLPWWRKVPAALSIVGAGMGFVSAIKGGGKSSGGGSSAGGGGSSAIAGQSQEGPLRVLWEGLDDNRLYEGRAIRRMYDALSKEAGDRGMVFVGAGG